MLAACQVVPLRLAVVARFLFGVALRGADRSRRLDRRDRRQFRLIVTLGRTLRLRSAAAVAGAISLAQRLLNTRERGRNDVADKGHTPSFGWDERPAPVLFGRSG